MTNLEDVATENEKSLQTLNRAIRLSQGEFSLILVRCNYDNLRAQMAQRLHQLSSVRISEITLPACVKTLYTTVLAELEDEQPNALMVFGLESVKDLDTVLTSANQVREEFRKNFSFPLLVWVNDRVLQKLIRLATDFENWATIVEFQSSTDELINFVRETTDEIFAGNTNLNPEICWQLKTALQDLQNRGQVLESDIQASLDFVFGLHEYQHNQMDIALQYYQQSLEFWQQQPPREQGEELSSLYHYGSNNSGQMGGGFLLKPHACVQSTPNKVSTLNSSSQNTLYTFGNLSVDIPPENLFCTQNFLERQGILLLHIGLTFYRKAEKNQLENTSYWQESRDYFQQCLDIFAQAKRPDLVALHITKLGEVLHSLKEWDALKSLAKKALQLHHRYGSQLQIAQSFSFLAEVALAQSRWNEAQQVAQKSLRILANVSNLDSHYLSKYRLILAQAQQHLGQIKAAIINLETARNESSCQQEPLAYIRILEKLRSLYFDNGEYLKAFQIKQEKISIEYQYGLRAFIGASHLHPHQYSIINTAIQSQQQEIVAQEITASGRQQDVNRLLERISRHDHKLTVIHGQSGVGKSSILKAGLIPALKQQSIGERDALPILLGVYRDWVGTLARCLTEHVETLHATSLHSLEDILQQLRQNADCNLLTVLIFDQFEEFFFVYSDQGERRQFYEFLRLCLELPYVKIILSLREDYLHYLLECERLTNLDVINNNILDKKNRYYLGKFSPQDAKAVIKNLTERTHFHLEPELIDKLVEDLASDGEIRPIELQIVGAQLQTDKITTLEKYHQIGTKGKLVENFLEVAIQDCGSQNERAARLVLYLLTDENGTRPLKTYSELVAELEALDLASEITNLDLVLKVLVGTGLVCFVPEAPSDRYQLIHDYLVSFIRQQQAPALLAELAAAKEQQKQTEEQLRSTLRKLEKALHKEKEERKRAEIAEIEALVSLSQALFLSHDQLGALLATVKALKKLQETELTPSIQHNIVNRIQQAICEVQEHNRLDSHTSCVTSVNFSPDRERIVSASAGKTIKIWSTEGTLLETVKAHRGIVWDVVISPDSKLIATASADTTVKLWTRDGKPLKTLSGHSDQVFSVTFSPDGETIASASGDRTIKLWSRDGRLLKTFYGHSEQVFSVSFSPDGEMIASSSTDKTVRLWTKSGELWTSDGTFLKTLCGHSFGVNSVKFSPDGKIIATASSDNTIKLWSKNGTLLKTLQGHTNGVNCVAISPDSKIIASASIDSTIKLWNKDGQTLCTLQGHQSGINYISFSPDGKTIASVSGDKTIKLWKRQGIKLQSSDINELLKQGCHWLRDYLKTNPNITKSDRHLCNSY